MPSKKYRVVISDRAKEMLGKQIGFLAESDKKQAREKKTSLIKAISSLDIFPERYPFFNETYIPVNKYHKMFVSKYYLVLYQIQDDIVYVDYIVDCRSNYSWLIR